MKSETRRRKSGSAVQPPARDTQAFTRLEAAAVLAALGLLALLVLPALANNRERSSRVVCVNNLRLAGQGFEQWGTEHSGRLPWRTPWCEGGTMPPNVIGSACSGSPLWVGVNQNSWFQWSWVSNELSSPKVLACPTDVQKRPASSWGPSANGGFLNANFQNRAVSYLLGLDLFPERPNGLLAGDRNVRFNLTAASCSSGLSPVVGLSSSSPPGSFGIGGGLHVEAGNFLFTDGRVEELSSGAFVKRWLANQLDDNGSSHFLVP